MAAYYHHHPHPHPHPNTEIPTTPSDHLNHTLFLMNPNFAPSPNYPDSHTPPSHNILLLNSAPTANNTPPPLHHHYARPIQPPPPPQHQESITLYGYPQTEARQANPSRQGLSLSLSSRNSPYGPTPNGLPPPGPDVEDDRSGGGSGSVMGSKYLKAAQELLEEVVHVGDGLLSKTSEESPKKGDGFGAGSGTGPYKGFGESLEEKNGGEGEGGRGEGGVQLSTAVRQELHMKKAKLMNMLDEAEQRYRQYHNQMQVVMASFEQAAGVGSAKTYTALALKTISKQFRCLKDAIQSQIKGANKRLGEDGSSGGLSSSGEKLEGSRLKYIDLQIRQQRELQQLGMIQNHNAWRPQRGLPERSVSVLRAWLFEHFLHPYPKDSDKVMLAKQTGLTRSQVSNWFINARVRLWKPMIEEMYTEEIKEQKQNGLLEDDNTKGISGKENSNNDSNSISNQENKTNIIVEQIQGKGTTTTLKDQNLGGVSSSSTPSMISIPTSSNLSFKENNNSFPHGFGFGSSIQMEDVSQGSPKRVQIRNDEVLQCEENNNSRNIFIKFGNHKEGRDNGYPMISGGMNMNFVGGGEELETYSTMGELGRFGTEEFTQARFLPAGTGISLSLGLPPCENQQQLNNTFLAHPNHNNNSNNHNNNNQFRRGHEFVSMGSSPPDSTPAAFECIDIQSRKGFAAQLLPDFVA